jgi:hypothetical protein
MIIQGSAILAPLRERFEAQYSRPCEEIKATSSIDIGANQLNRVSRTRDPVGRSPGELATEILRPRQ